MKNQTETDLCLKIFCITVSDIIQTVLLYEKKLIRVKICGTIRLFVGTEMFLHAVLILMTNIQWVISHMIHLKISGKELYIAGSGSSSAKIIRK